MNVKKINLTFKFCFKNFLFYFLAINVFLFFYIRFNPKNYHNKINSFVLFWKKFFYRNCIFFIKLKKYILELFHFKT
jgi:hypothetical protein